MPRSGIRMAWGARARSFEPAAAPTVAFDAARAALVPARVRRHGIRLRAASLRARRQVGECFRPRGSHTHEGRTSSPSSDPAPEVASGPLGVSVQRISPEHSVQPCQNQVVTEGQLVASRRGDVPVFSSIRTAKSWRAARSIPGPSACRWKAVPPTRAVRCPRQVCRRCSHCRCVAHSALALGVSLMDPTLARGIRHCSSVVTLSVSPTCHSVYVPEQRRTLPKGLVLSGALRRPLTHEASRACRWQPTLSPRMLLRLLSCRFCRQRHFHGHLSRPRPAMRALRGR
mmetsp:Transcript_59082/g.192768  ORF Transcript_59082/g.192768 Transcript_59082/m.192768 type:complete len:286 (-) Transcript_59082:2227-3084(-)